MIEQIPRTVKPRRAGYQHRPIVAIRGDAALFESGEIVSVEEIDWRTLPPHTLVGVNLPRLVAKLDRRYSHRSDWQWHATDRSLNEGLQTARARTVVESFGFQDRNRKRHHYHFCLDALTFYQSDNTLSREQSQTLGGLQEWAIQIREFCERNNLALKPTASGIAAQHLRDPRFYPNSRRKVPRATNQSVRPALPGNHYLLSVTTKIGERYQALEVDQTRAHHFHAERTPLPDADTLFAFGDFHNLEEITYAEPPDRDFHGLYYLRLHYGNTDASRVGYIPEPFRSFRLGETRLCFVWSNELPLLTDSGFGMVGVVAGWGSRNRDQGLPKFARYCQSELDHYADAAWLKPILLTTYGILACNPRAPEAVYKQSDKGKPHSLIAGGREWLHGYLVSHTNGKKIEPGVANVLHRGLIESATRAETIRMARYLNRRGVRILQVYADSLIVEDDASRPIPELWEPWRVKQPLTDYQPVNLQAFVSLQKTRLPGVTRDVLSVSSVGTFGRAPRKLPETKSLLGESTPSLCDPEGFAIPANSGVFAPLPPPEPDSVPLKRESAGVQLSLTD